MYFRDLVVAKLAERKPSSWAPTRVLRLPPKHRPRQDEPLLYSYKWSYKVITLINGRNKRVSLGLFHPKKIRGVITSLTYFTGFFGTHGLQQNLPCRPQDPYPDSFLACTWNSFLSLLGESIPLGKNFCWVYRGCMFLPSYIRGLCHKLINHDIVEVSSWPIFFFPMLLKGNLFFFSKSQLNRKRQTRGLTWDILMDHTLRNQSGCVKLAPFFLY